MCIMKAIRERSSRVLSSLGSTTLISSPQTSFTRRRSVSKIAIFTEGQTEQIFVEQLLFEVVGRQGLVVHSKLAMGGSRFPRFAYNVSAPAPTKETRFLALIWNC